MESPFPLANSQDKCTVQRTEFIACNANSERMAPLILRDRDSWWLRFYFEQIKWLLRQRAQYDCVLDRATNLATTQQECVGHCLHRFYDTPRN